MFIIGERATWLPTFENGSSEWDTKLTYETQTLNISALFGAFLRSEL